MDCEKVRLGITAWFLGTVVPAMHHALLHWPIAAGSNSSSVRNSQLLFKHLPWIDYAYFIAMGLVGLYLVVSGISAREKP